MNFMSQFSLSLPFVVVGLILTLVSCQAIGRDGLSPPVAVSNATKRSQMHKAGGSPGFQRGPSSDATTTQKLNNSTGSAPGKILSNGINSVESSNLGSYQLFGRGLATSTNISSGGQAEQPMSKISARSLIISVGGGGIIKTNPMESNRGNNPNGPAFSQQPSNSNPSSGSQQRPPVNPTSSPPSTSNVTVNSQQSGSNTISNTQNSSSNAASNSQQPPKNGPSNPSQSTSNSTSNSQQSSSNATFNSQQPPKNGPSNPSQSTSNSTSNSQQSSSNATSNSQQSSSNATSNPQPPSSNATSNPHQSLQNEPNPALESLRRNINFASRTDSTALLRNAVKQTPKLYWIGCSDSRVSETLLIEAELGEVFVERNIANLFKAEDARTSAGMEYAIHSLNVSHVVLVGHEGCGGCVTALASARENVTGKAPAEKLSVGEQAIVDWIAPIRQMAVDMLQRIGGTSAQRSPTAQEYRKQLSTLVELNVFQQARNILTSPVVKDAKRQGRSIWVYGWIYDIETGKIRQVLSESSL